MLFEFTSLSVIFSFILTELTGLLSGGLVSAGYLAYYYKQPLRILSTLIAAMIITLVIRLLKSFMLIYGRRRFMISIILSIMIVYFVNRSSFMYFYSTIDLRIIGYIIPGLIASDMEKQGIVKTIIALCFVTLLIILISFLV